MKRKCTDVLPHPDGERLAIAAVQRGQRLACAVRDEGAWEVARITDPLNRDELVALCVALAAMVPLDRSAAELLDWLEPKPTPAGYPELTTDAALRQAHAAHQRGERHPWAVEGERRYQARAYQRRRQLREAS